jgi:hypothetical protein
MTYNPVKIAARDLNSPSWRLLYKINHLLPKKCLILLRKGRILKYILPFGRRTPSFLLTTHNGKVANGENIPHYFYMNHTFIIILFSLLFQFVPTTTHASYIEACTVEAKLIYIFNEKEKPMDALNVKVESVKLQKGSHGNKRCLALKHQTIKIFPVGDLKALKVGETYTFKYTYTDSLGPKGIEVTEKWELYSAL